MNRIAISLPSLCLLLLPSCGLTFMRKPLANESTLTTAPSGKALVNFHRPSNWGGGQQYRVFDREKLIGNTVGKTRFQYVCDPGEHVFIGTAQRGSAIKADLAADKVYDVVINISLGMFRANITMDPITKGHKKRSEVDAWAKRARLWIYADDKSCRAFEERRNAWAKQTLADFLGGSHAERLKILAADDHR